MSFHWRNQEDIEKCNTVIFIFFFVIQVNIILNDNLMRQVIVPWGIENGEYIVIKVIILH